MFQRIEDDYQPKSVYHVTSVPDGAPLPLYEMPPRFPIGRSAFAVDAYRCPLLAAIVFKLARASNVSLISSQGLEAPGLVCNFLFTVFSMHAHCLLPICCFVLSVVSKQR